MVRLRRFFLCTAWVLLGGPVTAQEVGVAGEAGSPEFLLARADSLGDQRPAEAVRLAEEALAAASAAGDRGLMGRARDRRAMGLEALGRTAEAVAEYGRALTDFQVAGDSARLAEVHSSLGLVYLGGSRFDSAAVHHERAVQLRRTVGDTAALSRSLNNLGVTYYQWGNYEPALEAFQQSLDLPAGSDDRISTLRVRNNLAKTYHDWGLLDRAAAELESVLPSVEAAGDAVTLGYTLNNLGMVRLDQGDLTAARELFERSIDVYRTTPDPAAGVALNDMSLGLLDVRAGAHDAAVVRLTPLVDSAVVQNAPRREARARWYLGLAHRGRGDAAAAERQLLAALALSSEISQRLMATEIRADIADLYEARGDFRSALTYLRSYASARDSLFDQAAAQRLASREARAQADRAERENIALRYEAEVRDAVVSRQRRIVVLAVALLVVTFVLIVTMVRSARARRREAVRVEEANEKLRVRNEELEAAMAEVRVLQGLIPICSSCKKVRNDGGYWEQVEGYVSSRSKAVFSHSICPECGPRIYGRYWHETDGDPGSDPDEG